MAHSSSKSLTGALFEAGLQAEPEVVEEHFNAQPQPRKPTVLVCAMAASKLPHLEGTSTYEANSVAEACRLFHQLHPDLVLISTGDEPADGKGLSDSPPGSMSDSSVPLSFGSQVARHIRAVEGNRHTGIIFVDRGAAGSTDLSVTCLDMGADDYVRADSSASELQARVKAVLRLKAMTDELRSVNHKLRVLSLTDELTGLANMRSFNQQFSEQIRGCRSGSFALGALMIDLDHFKLVNDRTNHLVGSSVISAVGGLLRLSGFCEPGDVAARYGGDEFIVTCAVHSLTELEHRASEVRRLIERTTFEHDGFSVKVTASIGAAWTPLGLRGRAEDLLKAADLMLYHSKKMGRNQVSAMVLEYPLNLHENQAQLLARKGMAMLKHEEGRVGSGGQVRSRR